jgi:hypothetical protein
MSALALWATTPPGGYGEQLITLAFGWLLGVLFLGLCELSFLGYLKLCELRAVWFPPQVAAETEDDFDTRPEPPAASQPVSPTPPLPLVSMSAPAASRNGQQPNAYAALCRNASHDGDSRSA